jgi:hypothetical protein
LTKPLTAVGNAAPDIAESMLNFVDMNLLAFSLAPEEHDTAPGRKSADLAMIFPGGW